MAIVMLWLFSFILQISFYYFSVAKHFSETFKELVPEGDASLTMVKGAQTSKRKEEILSSVQV